MSASLTNLVESDDESIDIPESFSYRLKRILLGPPLINDELKTERLGRPSGMAILSSDVMSSVAYATEQILVVLVVAIGMGAYKLVVPITLSMIGVLFFVMLSYLQVIKAYPKVGGGYIVTRDNFGPKLALVAASALFIDYSLTAALSIVSGVDALASALPRLSPFVEEISVFLIVILVYANLRGLRESGRIFSGPTYLFISSMALMLILGFYKLFTGHLASLPAHQPGAYPLGHPGMGYLQGASLLVLAQAFANSGSAMTGTEAISNGVNIFKLEKKFKLRNKVLRGLDAQSYLARTVLVAMSVILAVMFFGTSFLAAHVHPEPRLSESPTVLAQIAQVVFGPSGIGKFLFYVLQISTLLILVFAVNTAFNGFPLLASFAAEDSFLPRQLMKRGHRLVFSNGLVILGAVSIALIVGSSANVSRLVALYAIGVFMSFTFAGIGMVKYHITHKEKRWRIKTLINGFAGILSAFVVLVFLTAKFLEGAWVVFVAAPLMVYAFLRFHRLNEREKEVLAENAPSVCVEKLLNRHVVIVLVERLDLATARTLRYARSLRPDELRAVHVILDAIEAHDLEESWKNLGLSNFPLELIDCPDRRLGRAVINYIADLIKDMETEVTVLIPRRVHEGLWRRLIHDRTSERLSAIISQLPNAAATIIPYRVDIERNKRFPSAKIARARPKEDVENNRVFSVSKDIVGAVKIADVQERKRAKIVGRVRSVRLLPKGDLASYECIVSDQTGSITLIFQGRRAIPGLEPGSKISAEGVVGSQGSRFVIINPVINILEKPQSGRLNKLSVDERTE